MELEGQSHCGMPRDACAVPFRAGNLFTRALSNFQGAVLLSERGMIIEARTLARSCLESTFCLAATVKGDSEFVHKMFLQDLDQRRKAANWLLSMDHLLEHVEDDAENQLRELVNKDLDKFSPLAIEEMARRGDIHNMYFCYRILSGDAAHPTFTALMRYVSDDGNPNNHLIQQGPDCGAEKIRDTVGVSCLSLIIACEAVNKVLANSEGEKERAKKELAQYFEEFKRLEKSPASMGCLNGEFLLRPRAKFSGPDFGQTMPHSAVLPKGGRES